MIHNRHVFKLIPLAVICTGCITMGAQQQPMVYPVVIPVYTPGPYNQQNAYAQQPQPYMLPPMGSAPSIPPQQQMAAMPPQQMAAMPQQITNQAPIVPPLQGQQMAGNRYSTPNNYNQFNSNAVQNPHPTNNSFLMNYPSQQAGPTPISIPVGQPVPTIPLQGMVSIPKNMAHMSHTQHLQMGDALFRYAEPELSKISQELAEVMQPTLEASACGIAWLPEMAARGADDMASKALVPFKSTPQHKSSSCLNVYQIDNWRMGNNSRLAFRVIFESPLSHERASRRFEIIRERDGWHYLSMNEAF